MNTAFSETQASQCKRPLKIGLLMPCWASSQQGDTRRWNDLLTFASQAETIGFDSLWVADELVSRTEEEVTGSWECWSLLGALAARTKWITLGTLVTCTSFRNPALIAHFAVTLDEVSNGRFILGLGVGGLKSAYDTFGFPWEHRFSRFEEGVIIIHRLLRTGYAHFSGKHFQVHECELIPRGPRPGGVPILIGTSVPPGPRMLRSVVLFADLWNGGLATGPFAFDVLSPALTLVDETCQTFARAPETLVRTISLDVVLPGYQERDELLASPAKALTGSPQEMAEVLRKVAQLGISHIQVNLIPATPAGLEKFAPVLEILEKG